MTVAAMDLPPEGMLLSGVALAGDPARGTATTEGLNLLFTAAGITVQGQQPDSERLLPWAGLDAATCHDQTELPGGRTASVMVLTSRGQTIRFLLPPETVSPGQAAYLDQALPTWLTRYKGAAAPTAAPAAAEQAAPAADQAAPAADGGGAGVGTAAGVAAAGAAVAGAAGAAAASRPAPAAEAAPAPPAPSAAPAPGTPPPPAAPVQSGVAPAPPAPGQPTVDPATGAASWPDPMGQAGPGPDAFTAPGKPKKLSRKERKAEAVAAAAGLAAAGAGAAVAEPAWGAGAATPITPPAPGAPGAFGTPSAPAQYGTPSAPAQYGTPSAPAQYGTPSAPAQYPGAEGTPLSPLPPEGATEKPNRRPLVLLVILLVVALGAGIFYLVHKNNNSSTTATTAAPATGSGSDQALAASINLKRTDLPAGWTVSAGNAPATAADKAATDQAAATLATCLGMPVATIDQLFGSATQTDVTATASSPKFTAPTPPLFSMQSTTQVVKTAADATADVAPFAKPNFVTCFQAFETTALAPEFSGGTAQVSQVTLTAPPGVTSYGYLTTIYVGGKAQAVLGDAFIVGGRIETTLSPVTAGQAVSPDVFTPAYNAVVGRVAAAKDK